MASGFPLDGLRVLVVEDEAILAFEMVEDLKAFGAEPLGPIATIGKAVGFIQATPRIDAALLNALLHRQVVFPVAEELQRRGIPFVFVTGNDEIVKSVFPTCRCIRNRPT